MVIDDSFYMHLAVGEAWKFQVLTYPNPAVGCTVVGKYGEILAVEAHKRAGEAHAEVEALKSAYRKITDDKNILDVTDPFDIHRYLEQNHNGCFADATLYVTLEPCAHIGKTPSCAELISKLQVKRVVIGSKDFNENASGGAEIIRDADIHIRTGVLKKECEELLFPFIKWQEDRFVFFKWAQRLNGTVDGGIISSQKSRELVHKMRDVCDLLVIGGETVRTDRPTLDARLCGGRAPDILIVSRSKEFDKNIPLFKVPDRKVIIADDLATCKNYKNIMIEGAQGMFELSKELTDYYLCFIAPKIYEGAKTINGSAELGILNIQKDEQDIIMWMKQRETL